MSTNKNDYYHLGLTDDEVQMCIRDRSGRDMGRLQRSTEEHTVRSQIATPCYSIGTGFCTHGRTGYLFYSGTDRHVESRKEIYRFYQLRDSGDL